MAKKSAVEKLIETANAVENKSDELVTAISALVALGKDATHSNGEYKDLKALLDATVNGTDAGTPTETPAQTPTEQTQNTTPNVDAQVNAPAKPKKYNYAGVRMIGSKWHCAKDNYKKGFDTADECAEHFNG